MGKFEVIARIKIRPGQMEGFKAQAAELIRLTKEKDTKTLRYDWFIDEKALECEVHEDYSSEDGLMEHNLHVMAARDLLFAKYAYDHRMSFFGDVSPQLVELANMHGAGASVYTFLQGLETPPRGKPASASAAV